MRSNHDPPGLWGYLSNLGASARPVFPRHGFAVRSSTSVPCSNHNPLLSFGIDKNRAQTGLYMPEKKPSKPPVAENPIADLFDGRHPSQSEKDWAEKTLLPTLEKSPEKPIGAP